MAEENLIQTNIVANANFAPLITDLNKVTLALTGLQEKLNASNKALATQAAVMNKAFAETLRSTGQFSTHFISLTSDVDKFGQQLDKGQIKLGQFFRLYQQHSKTSGGIIRDLAKQQVQMQNAILQPLGRNAEGLMQYNVHIPRGLDLVKNKTKIASQELSIMNRFVQEGANQLINWGKNTQWAGRQLTVGLTVPMAAFGKAAADAFRTADEQLVRLTKVYGGLTATTSTELAKVRKDVTATATALAKGYGASFNETLGLAADIAATGKQGNELLGSIKETTRLSVLGEVDRQEAMKATLAIQTAFKQNTVELSDSINFLNAVENQTSTTLQDLVEAIPKAGPVVRGLGGSIKDLALYLTAMKEGGISAAEGANALKSGLASLINPTKVATNMFAGFGVDLKGIVAKNAGNVTATLLELQAALDKLDPLQKQQALEQLFGKFQFARMNALFSNLGKQGSQTLQVLDLMKASSQDLANIAGRELSQVTESASGKYRRALEGLKADLAGVGDQFLTISTHLINLVDGVIKFAQNLPGPIKTLLNFIGMFTAGLGPVIMLTGVLGNFFGYIIKGAYHFKALFKGAEGWKLLTPEILAANKAGSLAEQTFYSDAKAAAILNQSLQGLIGSYNTLQTKVNTGIIPTATTQAVAMAGLGRQVNPASKYISAVDTRQMSHLNPVSAMTDQEKMAQTMFGVVPGAPKVNQSIGATPQIYMTKDIAKVQGASEMKGVSTGIVAEEAAKWHSMTAALGMQSKAELARLRRDILATGTITNELAQAYEAMLPKMNDIVNNAANASESIVMSLKANKISAQQARAEIIALNAQTEQLMASAAQDVAAGLGRNINVTQVPMLNQPVIDPKTGKSNMKELLKKGRTRGLVNSIARVLGVKTYGASYSMQTTIPKKFNSGGNVFLNNGDQVPGPNVNADVVPAMLTPGEFVIRRGIAQQDPEGMRALNAGQAMIVPIQQRINGGEIFNVLRGLKGVDFSRVTGVRRIYDAISSRTNKIPNPSSRKFLENSLDASSGYHLFERRTGRGWTPQLLPGQRKEDEVLAHVFTSKFLRRFKNFDTYGASPRLTGAQMKSVFGSASSTATRNKQYQLLPGNFINVPKDFNLALRDGIATGNMWLNAGRKPEHLVALMSNLLDSGVPYKVAYRVASRSLNRINKAMSNLGDRPLSETRWGNVIDDAMSREIANIQSSYQKGSAYAFNRGGSVPGYIGGGSIGGVLSKAAIFKRLKAMFSVNEGGRGYSINALPMKPNTYMFRNLPISYRAKKYLYDALVHNVANRPGRTTGTVQTGPMTQFGRMSKTVKGFGHADQYDIWQDVSRLLATNPNLSPKDKAYFEKVVYGQINMPLEVGQHVLGLNKGGMVPGYIRGGGISRLNRLKMQGFWPGAASSKLNYTDEGELLPGPAPKGMPIGSGMVSGLIGSSLGMSVGSAVGGQSGAMVGSLVGSFLPNIISKIVTATKAAGGLAKIAFNVGKFIKAWSIPGAILTALAFGAKKMWDWHKSAEAIGKANRLAFGGTVSTLGEVGLKYTTVADKLKMVNQQLDLQKAKGKEAYAALTNSGVSGLTMTIKELQDRIKDVKKNATETVSAFSNTKGQEGVDRLAASLKQQYVSAGMSVQEATNNIYAMIKASTNADKALGAITTKAFTLIKDKSTAATTSVAALGKVLDNRKLFNAEEFARGIDNMLNSVDAYRQSLVGTKINDKVVTQAEALRITMEKISKVKGSNNKLDDAAINGIKQQDLLLGSMLGKAETLSSVYAKMALMQSGFSNVGSLSGDQAILIAQGMQKYQDQVAAAAQSTSGPIASLAKLSDKYKKASDAAASTAKAAAGMTSDAIDAEIKKRQKLIDKLQEEQKARLAALDAQQKSEDFSTSLKQAQIQYQEALAAGDMAAAAQEKLNVEKLQADRQRELTRTSIEDKYNADVKKLQDEIQVLQDKKSAQSASATTAQTNATNRLADYQKIQGYMTRLAAIAQQYPNSEDPAAVGMVKSVLDDMKKDGGEIAAAGRTLSKQYVSSAPGAVSGGTTTESNIIKGLSASGFKLEGAGEFKAAVLAFSQYVGKLIGEKPEKTASALKKTLGTFAVDYTTYMPTNIGGVKKASGGGVWGPGSSTSDSIPAMLSNGEYVVNAASASKFGYGNLDKINKMAQGGIAIPNMPKLRLMGGTDGGVSNNAYNVTMNFAEAPSNARELFNEFKALLSADQRTRQSMNGNVRYV